jgi:ATP-dependent DNA helicase RecQ
MLKGCEQPLLLEPAKKKTVPKPVVAKDSWEGVDRELCEELRKLRSKLAREKAVPAYIIFGDATLRDMARKIPSTPDALLLVSGIGMKKLEQYGERIIETILRHKKK